jgi:hypothetical protein
MPREIVKSQLHVVQGFIAVAPVVFRAATYIYNAAAAAREVY